MVKETTWMCTVIVLPRIIIELMIIYFKKNLMVNELCDVRQSEKNV